MVEKRLDRTKKHDQKRKNKKSPAKFVKDLRVELKKVTWLTWPQLVKNTITVIVACLIIGSVIWIFDAAIGRLIAMSLLR